MVSDAERMARAGEYVLGRMDAAERERAERDLESDDRFRAAVLAVAERMHYFGSARGRGASAAAEAAWAELAQRLGALPHMQAVRLPQMRPPAAPLPTGAAPSADPPKGRVWRRAAAGLSALLERLCAPRPAAPAAVALLHAPGDGPAALVELFSAGGRLRVLMLRDLAAGETLALWAEREDGRVDCLGALARAGETRLRGPAALRCIRLMIARRRQAPAPSAKSPVPVLAEGVPQALAVASGISGDRTDRSFAAR